MSLFAAASDDEVDPVQRGEIDVLDVDSDRTSVVIDALGSETGRAVLAAIHDEAATASELADNLDESVQTVSYHLSKLEAADLIEEGGTRYSDRGREMQVYAPADDPCVVFVGTDERKQGLLAALKRLAFGIVVLAGATVGVNQWLSVPDSSSPAPTTRATESTGPSIASTPSAGAADAAAAATGPDPAVVFFLGGLFVFAVIATWWAWKTRFRKYVVTDSDERDDT